MRCCFYEKDDLFYQEKITFENQSFDWVKLSSNKKIEWIGLTHFFFSYGNVIISQVLCVLVYNNSNQHCREKKLLIKKGGGKLNWLAHASGEKGQYGPNASNEAQHWVGLCDYPLLKVHYTMIVLLFIYLYF